MANNSPAAGAGNCQQQQAAQHQAGSLPPAQPPLQSGAPKPAASGKQGNVLPLWGNEKTMNLNPMILTNILSSPYFKVQLYELKTYHEVVDEIYFKVRPAEAGRHHRGSGLGPGPAGSPEAFPLVCVLPISFGGAAVVRDWGRFRPAGSSQPALAPGGGVPLSFISAQQWAASTFPAREQGRAGAAPCA
uniref:Pre-mRNA-splicing factor 38B n=1 Tax=Chelonoidis abingdonii TaxID=106734 RepID=A0A8C0IPV4_CHEAB